MTSRGPCFEAFELIFFFHLCSGAFTSLCQHINGLCDVSCQGSSLITRGRLSEAVNPSGLALYLTKSRERHTHTHTHKEIYKEWKQQLVIPLQYRPPTGTPTSHTCSTFSSLEVCLSVWMLPLSTGRDLNTARSALHSTCFRMYCQQSLHFKLFL